MSFKHFFKKEWRLFKRFYGESAENRMGIYNLFGFIVIPIIGMVLLYLLVYFFWL